MYTEYAFVVDRRRVEMCIVLNEIYYRKVSESYIAFGILLYALQFPNPRATYIPVLYSYM